MTTSPVSDSPGDPTRIRVASRLITALWISIGIWVGTAGHRAIPPSGVQVEGDPALAYDSEIGFVPRPNSASKRTHFGPDGTVSFEYHLYTDRRGARMSRPGEQTPDHVDVLIVGDSFTWGHGVENQETFASRTIRALGVTGANFGLGSYGTTHSLQMLRRNRDLKPRLVIYSFTVDQARRNILACAPSYYPFCLDYSYVAWSWGGKPYIAPPRSDGVRRLQRQARLEKAGLDSVERVRHEVDAAAARVTALAAQRTAADTAKQDAALDYLIGEMVGTVNDMKAALVIAYIPARPVVPPPERLTRLASVFGFRFLDVSRAFTDAEGLGSGPSLYIPHDGHLSTAGHALVAQELARFIQEEKLLPR